MCTSNRDDCKLENTVNQSFHSQWWFGLPCHLLVLVHCFLKSTVNAAIYQEILEHFMLPSADKLYGDAGFIFQQDLAPAHTTEGALCKALPGKQFLLTLEKWHLAANN